jgi:hypothetical protein
MIVNDQVHYSTGHYNIPNYSEAAAALNFYSVRSKSKSTRQLMVLPTGTERARRFLKAVIGSDPDVVHNLVVVSGDSITFNNIYRDRKVAWNIMDLPVTLVFFQHRNPMYQDPLDQNGPESGKVLGFLEHGTENCPWATTGTQDLLLYRDILEALILAGWRDGNLVDTADELDQRLGQLRWVPIDKHGQKIVGDLKGEKIIDGHLTFSPMGNLFFDSARNREIGTGEYIVLLQPNQHKGMVTPEATLSIWSRKAQAGIDRSWEEAAKLCKVNYADTPTPVLNGPVGNQ